MGVDDPMSGETLVMRYRDLGGIEDALQEHKKIVDETGFVWAGWWATPAEMVPLDAIKRLKVEANKHPISLFLLNSTKRAIYPTLVCDIAFASNSYDKIPTPDPTHTPEYYSGSDLLLWFKIIRIEKPVFHDYFVKQYAYQNYRDFRTLKDNLYQYYDNIVVDSIEHLSLQPRTLMLLREKVGSDGHISENDEIRRVKRGNFHDSYIKTESNSMLLLSDLHFSVNSRGFQFSDCENKRFTTKKSLSEALYDLTGREVFASIMCAGDFTYGAEPIEFKKAEEFLFTLANNYSVDKSNIVIVPGNHDMKFSNKSKSGIVYTLSEAKRGYERLYTQLYGTEPNKFFAIGRKILLKNCLPVEIIGLNSNCLQQERDHFYGMGYVGNEQLALVANEMGWNDSNHASYAYRILILHHHLYPVEPYEEPQRDHYFSLCLDAGSLTSFILKHRINLVVHGHKHRRNFIQIGGVSDSQPEHFNLLGLGSASSTDISHGDCNTIATLDFSKFGFTKIRVFDINNPSSNCIFERSIQIWK